LARITLSSRVVSFSVPLTGRVDNTSPGSRLRRRGTSPHAILVKVRDGQVANRPIYAAIGVTVDGRKDVLGLWAGTVTLLDVR
jgi:hypothetical protein